MRATRSLLLLVVALGAAACGGEGTPSATSETPRSVAGTPEKALEIWVTAAQAGDVRRMCTVILRRGIECDEALARKVRSELRGVGPDPEYRLIYVGRGRRPGASRIGVAVGESGAYAVDLLRTATQWTVRVSSLKVVIEAPTPGATIPRNRTRIAFQAVGHSPGSSYPGAQLWLDERPLNGNYAVVDENDDGVDRVRWSGIVRAAPGRHVLVAGVRLWGEVAVRAWVFTAE